MTRPVRILALAVALMIAGTSCHKEDSRKIEPEDVLTVDNKLIIGEWKHQQTQLSVFDASTGAAISNRDYDLPQIKTLTFTADGKYFFDRTNSGTYGINTAATTLTFRDAYGKNITSEVKALDSNRLIISSAETSENTRLVLLQFFTR